MNDIPSPPAPETQPATTGHDPVIVPAAPAAPVRRQPPVCTLPDWKGAPASHWLTQWEQHHGLQRVMQHDWQRPLRGDWMMQLQETVLRHERVHLLAHGLGAHLVDAWLRHTQQARRLLSVLLVDPIDLQDPACQEVLFTWKPLAPQAWPVPVSVLWKERQLNPEVQAVLNAWGASPLAEAAVGGGVVGGWSLTQAYWTDIEAKADLATEA
ncbi:MAG: hypothetical protein RIT26_2427 [Pseudomonadota bacterium]